MAHPKRPRTLARADVPRTGPRDPVVITGTYQVGERPAEDVLVTNLSAEGCKLQGDSVGVTKSEPMRLWLGEFGPLVARLKWLKRGSVGLAFDTPLDEAVVRRLCEAAPAPMNVVALKRSER